MLKASHWKRLNRFLQSFLNKIQENIKIKKGEIDVNFAFFYFKGLNIQLDEVVTLRFLIRCSYIQAKLRVFSIQGCF